MNEDDTANTRIGPDQSDDLYQQEITLQDDVTRQVPLYRINSEFWEFEHTRNSLARVLRVIRHLENTYKVKMVITIEKVNGVQCMLCTYTPDERMATWEAYLPPHLTHTHHFETLSNFLYGFILVKQSVFCFIGGQAKLSTISKFIDPIFGTRFLSQVLGEDDRILELRARSLSGNLANIGELYKESIPLVQAQQLNMVTTDLKVDVSAVTRDSIFPYFDDRPRVLRIDASNSIKLSYALTFAELLEVAATYERIYSQQSKSTFDFLTVVSDQRERHRLDGNLLRVIYESSQKAIVKMNITVLNPKRAVQFLQAEQYRLHSIKLDVDLKIPSKNLILVHAYRIAESKMLRATDYHGFRAAFLSLKLDSIVGDKRVTTDTLYRHLDTELKRTNRFGAYTPMYHIGGVWYSATSVHSKVLLAQCQSILDTFAFTGKLSMLNWPTGMTEGDYNLLYEKRPDILVFDKALSRSVELCDLLLIEDKTIFLIHVKAGFDAKMRDLTLQIQHSQQMLLMDSGEKDVSFVLKAFALVKEKHGMTDLQFMDLFKNKAIKYVAAFCSKSKQRTARKAVAETNSNVARLSLYQLFQSSARQLSRVEVALIPRTT